MNIFSEMIPMRDGVRLESLIHVPAGEGRFPALVCRIVYNMEAQKKTAERFVDAGFAVVLQHVRGRGCSEGQLDGGKLGGEDGFDTFEWVAKQPWCDGNIGTFGRSALARVQVSAALLGHPRHRAMAPHVLPFGMNLHCGGAFLYSQLPVWIYWTQGGPKLRPYEGIDWTQHLSKLPVSSALDGLGGPAALYHECLREPHLGFSREPPEKFSGLDIPALLVTGWYDHCLTGPLDFYAHVCGYASASQRQNTHLVIGPWDHACARNDFDQYDFGPQAVLDFAAAEIDFFSRHLKGHRSKPAPAAVRIFVMEKDQWRDEREWPLARAVNTLFYLRGNGGCVGMGSAGTLSTTPPGAEPPEKFTYDPADPVPTVGGNNPGPARVMPMKRGPRDQRPVLNRKDVCVYLSDPLKEPLEVTGPLRVVLYAASSALDTDFTAKLFNVAPDGDCMLLQDGIVRARFRHGLSHPLLLNPGEVEKFEIDLWATSYEFQPGHRIGLAISSSNFPRFNRNLNTGGNNEMDSKFVAARQTIYHDSRYPSHVILPVVK